MQDNYNFTMNDGTTGLTAPWVTPDVALSSPSMTGQRLTHQQMIQVAKEFGTPVYVYHAEKIAEQYRKLTDAFSKSNVVFFMPARH
jgi:hypothetical protein